MGLTKACFVVTALLSQERERVEGHQLGVMSEGMNDL